MVCNDIDIDNLEKKVKKYMINLRLNIVLYSSFLARAIIEKWQARSPVEVGRKGSLTSKKLAALVKQ